MGKKGIINVLELITVVLILFVSFSIFFPRVEYKNRWEEAYIILKARDVLLLLERTGDLYKYAFDLDLVKDLSETLFPESNLIMWAETERAIKSDIKIACVCDSETIVELNSWVKGLKLNERNITINFCSADLDSPGLCIDESDGMVISEYQLLQPYEQLLTDYISEGKGILEVMDFEQESEVNDDPVQTGIFGLEFVDIKKVTMGYVEFPRSPNNASDIIFEPRKYFYHIPRYLEANDTGESIVDCGYDPAKNGTLISKGVEYGFWICSDDSVWFDTDGDIARDILAYVWNVTTIGGYDIALNYVNDDSSIGVSFKPDYEFDDFLSFVYPGGLKKIPPGQPPGIWRTPHIRPTGNDQERVLLASISESPPREYPCVILNKFGETGVAWSASLSDFAIADDEKLLFISLLLWISNKHAKSTETPSVGFGHLESYVSTKNIDMFEAYKFSLGLGYPF